MLTIQAAESAYPTTKILDEKGIAIVARPNSLLASLVATTYINFDPALQNGQYHHDLNAMCALTDQATSITGYSEHTARMEETADFLAKMLEKQIFTARTVVAPFVDAYAQRLHQSMELIGSNPDNGVEVVLLTQPGPLAEPSLIKSIQRASNITFSREHTCVGMPDLDDNMIRSFMATGAASVDASITEHFAKKPEGWLASRWKSIFCSQQPPDVAIRANYTPMLDDFITGRENVDTALMVFLVTRRIWNAPIEGVNMTEKAYEDTMVAYRDQSALRLCHELERLDRESQAGILVAAVENTVGGRKLTVNASVYKDFIAKGGSNEVLMGNLLQNYPEVRVDVLLEKKDLLEATWNRHYSANKALYDQKRLLQMREALPREWLALAQEYSPEDFPVHERASSFAMVLRMANTFTPKDFDDLYALSLKICNAARFYKTDAAQILGAMKRARENNPGISAEESAHIAVSEYVFRWIGSDMTPVSANKVEVFTARDTMLS